jgi:putative transport protein
MTTLLELLAGNPLLLLFAVVALGYPLGRLAVRGVSIGTAAILFSGLLLGALDPRLRLPEIVHQLGLVLFVYSVGLSSGPGFFASFRRHGVQNACLVAAALLAATMTTVLAARLLDLPAGIAAGVFAGSVTNTPALAAVLEVLRGDTHAATGVLASGPVVAYSVTYPLGVLIPIVLMAMAGRAWARRGGGHRADAEWPASDARRPTALQSTTVRVTRPDAAGRPIRELRGELGLKVLPGRIRRAGGPRAVDLATEDTVVGLDDLVTFIGRAEDIERITARLGVASDEAIHLDRNELDIRRMFVSNREVAGHSLRELDLPQQFGAVVTALRRGDADWVPNGHTVLQLGDRVRVLTRRESLPKVSAFLGDSYRDASEFDVLTFGFGIVLGIALGVLPIPIWPGVTVSFGLAGGPLVVAMILGARGRTGPLVWGIPYGASQTLRQLGLIMFFAGIGTRSGYAFAGALADSATIGLIAAGAAATTAAAGAVLLIGRYVFRIPTALLAGMVAGVHTQPAALAFAIDATRDEKPNEGYAAVFALATIMKLIIAQLLVRAWE